MVVADASDPYEEARDLCGKLDPGVLEWSVSSYDARSDETRSGDLTFDETFALERMSPVARRSVRWRFRIDAAPSSKSVGGYYPSSRLEPVLSAESQPSAGEILPSLLRLSP